MADGIDSSPGIDYRLPRDPRFIVESRCERPYQKKSGRLGVPQRTVRHLLWGMMIHALLEGPWSMLAPLEAGIGGSSLACEIVLMKMILTGMPAYFISMLRPFVAKKDY